MLGRVAAEGHHLEAVGHVGKQAVSCTLRDGRDAQDELLRRGWLRARWWRGAVGHWQLLCAEPQARNRDAARDEAHHRTHVIVSYRQVGA